MNEKRQKEGEERGKEERGQEAKGAHHVYDTNQEQDTEDAADDSANDGASVVGTGWRGCWRCDVRDDRDFKHGR